MNPRSSRALLLSAAIVAPFAHWSCNDNPATHPDGGTSNVAEVDVVAVRAANDPPDAVFRTTPPAHDGVISGPGPLTVEFNLCQSRDRDEGDDLRYTYDFDGDGEPDQVGHCRASHVYPRGCQNTSNAASVCVWDRQPGDDHRVCNRYEVCVGENSAPARACLSASFSGTLDSSLPLQTGRLSRNGITSTCAGKANPGLNDATVQRHYAAYSLRNNESAPVCMRAELTGNCNTTDLVVAYLGSFNPASPGSNYLGDPGSSDTTSTFNFTVPAHSDFTMVVHHVNAGAAACDYQLTVSGC